MNIRYYDADTHEVVPLGERDALKAEVERLRVAPPTVYVTDIEAAVKEWGDWNEALTAVLRKHTRPIDQTSPAVCAVDVKAAARSVSRIIEGGDEGNFEGTVEAALYEHTRPVSVESVAQALYESAAPRTVHDWPLASGVTKETYIVQARAALRVIGARLAEPAAQPAKPREGFVVDRGRFNGIANRAGLAVARAIDECIAEIERQRAEFERGGAE